MTTKLAYRLGPPIDYSKLSFDPDDPEPLPGAMYQYPVFEEIFHILGTHITSLHPSDEVFRSSNTFICYDPSNLNVRVGPDFYAAFGVDAEAIKRRKLYLPWEVGKAPDLVLEVGSESTARQDLIAKRQIYARIGVTEYWRFDGTGGEFYGQPLAGDFLQGSTYSPTELTAEPDGVLKGYSPVLRLSLCWRDEKLIFFNPETGEYLRNLPQTEAILSSERAARESAEAALSRERAARESAEAVLSRERAARESAEARIRNLEEQLRRQQGG